MTEQEKIQNIIADCFKTYQIMTNKLSNVIRQLAFAEAGVFWVLIYQNHQHVNSLKWGFLFLILFFASDALHYYIGSQDYLNQARSWEQKSKENKNSKAIEFVKPVSINSCSRLFFNMKIIFITITSLLLISYLFT